MRVINIPEGYNPSQEIIVQTGDVIQGVGYSRDNGQAGSSIGRIRVPGGVRDFKVLGVACHQLLLGTSGPVDRVPEVFDGEFDVQVAWPEVVGSTACVSLLGPVERLRGYFRTIGGQNGVRLAYDGVNDMYWDGKTGAVVFDMAYHTENAIHWDARVTRGFSCYVTYHGASTDRGQPFNSKGALYIAGDVRQWTALTWYSEITNSADGGSVVTVAPNNAGQPYRVKIQNAHFDRSTLGVPVQRYEVDASRCVVGRKALVIDGTDSPIVVHDPNNVVATPSVCPGSSRV